MPQSETIGTVWDITQGPGKYDLQQAIMGVKPEVRFNVVCRGTELLRSSVKFQVSGMLREGGEDCYILLGFANGESATAYYETKRIRGEKFVGFLRYTRWELVRS